jgi:uncharacterized ferredoxin-like protein
MTFLVEKDFLGKKIESIAEAMCVAARTAPKGRGIDLIVTAIAAGDTVKKLSAKMKEMGEAKGTPSFIRDAENLSSVSHVVLIGTKLKVIGLKNCALCGYPTCEEKDEKANCALNVGDLGIAIGSAVSVAADHRVDSRIMFSVGRAAVELGLFDKDVKIVYGIPLSVTGKNPFFDRK